MLFRKIAAMEAYDQTDFSNLPEVNVSGRVIKAETLWEDDVNDEVATEGFMGTLKDKLLDMFHSRKEVDVDVESQYVITNDKNIYADIENLNARIANKKALRDDPAPIKLGVHAKYLAVNGKLITDSAGIVKELAHIRDLVRIFDDKYVTNLTHFWEYVAEHIFKVGTTDIKKADANWKGALDVLYPKEIDALLTQTEEFRAQNGGKIISRVTPKYMGDFCLVADQPTGEKYRTKAYFVEVMSRPDHKIKNGVFKPFTPDQVKEITKLCQEILDHIEAMVDRKRVGPAANKLNRAIDNFEHTYSNLNNFTSDEVKDIRSVYGLVNIAFSQRNCVLDLSAIVNKELNAVCDVALASVRRMV